MIYLTITIFRCFSKQPSPLNGMLGGNHHVRWFSDGLGVPQPLCPDGFRWLSTIGQTMWCDGPSFQSTLKLCHCGSCFNHFKKETCSSYYYELDMREYFDLGGPSQWKLRRSTFLFEITSDIFLTSNSLILKTCQVYRVLWLLCFYLYYNVCTFHF